MRVVTAEERGQDEGDGADLAPDTDEVADLSTS